MDDDLMIRARVREALQAGRLPDADPLHTWGGRGEGRDCDVCGRPIQPLETEFELEFLLPGRSRQIHHMHARCFIAWQQVRHER